MKYRIKNTNITLKAIAYYQIYGGILGLLLVSWLLIQTGQINGAILFIFLLTVSLYVLSINAGRSLLRDDNLKKGLILSLISQALQVIAIGIGEYSYLFFSGANATIGFSFTDGFQFIFGAAISSTFSININSPDAEHFLKLNLLAVALFSVLADIYDEHVKAEKEKAIVEPAVVNDKEALTE